MLELHKYLEECEGCPILVLDGDDKIGIVAMNTKREYFVVTKDKKVYQFPNEQKAYIGFDRICKPMYVNR